MPETSNTEHRTPEGAALPKLSARHTVFVEQYFACNLNASAASRACKYANLGEGWRLLQREDVSAHVSARMAQFMPANEVLQRLSALARTDGSQFMKREEYEVPVFEPRSLQERIDNAEAKVGRMMAIEPGLLKSQIETEQGKIAGWEVELALNPQATYQKQVGTEMRWRIVPSLEAAADNGVLFAIESAEYTQHGLKFKRQDNVKALELIGKHHKLFTDRTELSGPDGEPLKLYASVDLDKI
jgi:phage terminase small subunit